jgi:sulfhydrogenase subunit beta (sulfur reductase)
MDGKVFIARENLSAVLEELSRKIEVWVPASSGKWGVEFAPFCTGMVPVFERQSTLPPKKAMLPQVETLLRFEYRKDQDDPSRVRVNLEEALETSPVLVFGARPCDARGFLTFDPVFTEGPYEDSYYRRRRENVYFATLVCRESDAACFCSSVGSGPSDMEGSDLRLTPIEGGFIFEALRERARPFVGVLGNAPTDAQNAAALEVQQEAANKRVGDLDVEGAPEAFKTRFEDKQFWQEMVSQCLSCGVCTFSCPTCYCFTITDETKEMKGERIRSWDSCMFPHYTQEASGHNPRPTKFERYRNRVGHKFSYFPEKHDGKIACCGCGRCIRSCPVSIDIRKVVQQLKESVDACQC